MKQLSNDLLSQISTWDWTWVTKHDYGRDERETILEGEGTSSKGQGTSLKSQGTFFQRYRH